MPTKVVQFPLTLPHDKSRQSEYAAALERELRGHAAICNAKVITPNGEAEPGQAPILELSYDPTGISLSDLKQYVARSGWGMNAAMAEVVLPIEGLISPRKESMVQAVLNRLPGVTAVVSFSAQTIRLEFDRRRCALPEVARQLEKLGIRIRSPREAAKKPPAALAALQPAWEFTKENLELVTAVIGGVLLGLATVVHVTDGSHTLRLVLVGAAFVLCGWHTTIETVKTLLRFRVDIDVLMFAAAFGAAGLGHYEEGALLLLLFALGGAGEHLAMGRARRAIKALTDLAPLTATRIENGEDRIVHVEDLKVGDRIRIAADEQVPADAEIIEGRSAVNQAPITGESVPVDKVPGDVVFAGTFNGQGNLIASVTRPASDNTLAKVIRLVEEAQTTKSPTQQMADRFERWYVPFVLITTALLMTAPPLAGFVPRQQDGALWSGWFYQALAFLTAASPCALAIGTPAAILSGIGRAARAGVLIKGGAHLENLSHVRVVAFDKTGTLTPGRPRVVRIVALYENTDEQRVLELAGAVENGSRHPLAEAIVNEAKSRQLALADADDVQRTAGLGIEGTVNGQRIAVGSPTMFADQLKRDATTDERVHQLQQEGCTVIGVVVDGRLMGLIALADEPRPTAAEAVRALSSVGIKQTVMLTGDNPEAAHHIARNIGITQVEAGLLPEQKLDKVRQLDQTYGGVAMVGDGVNDAPAMASATVGIAIGGATGVGSDVALETADVALMADDLRPLPEALGLAKFTRRIVRQNLVIALGVIAILAPIAAMGGAPISLAVFFHEGSTVVVVLNALRILAFRSPLTSR